MRGGNEGCVRLVIAFFTQPVEWDDDTPFSQRAPPDLAAVAPPRTGPRTLTELEAVCEHSAKTGVDILEPESAAERAPASARAFVLAASARSRRDTGFFERYTRGDRVIRAALAGRNPALAYWLARVFDAPIASDCLLLPGAPRACAAWVRALLQRPRCIAYAAAVNV